MHHSNQREIHEDCENRYNFLTKHSDGPTSHKKQELLLLRCTVCMFDSDGYSYEYESSIEDRTMPNLHYPEQVHPLVKDYFHIPT